MTSALHHISAGSFCPGLAKIPGLMPRQLVCHVVVVEGPDGLTLVDTGIGTADVRDGRLPKAFVLAMGAELEPGATVLAQLPGLGYTPGDVTDIVVTHLDLDHAGGISDFPNARVHVDATELEAATAPTMREKARYLAAQWAHGPNWVTSSEGGDDWFGFSGVRTVTDDVLLIPLPGHSRGHAVVAVRRPGGAWLLHAGDAYFHTGEKQTPPTCPRGLKGFQAFAAYDNKTRKANAARLRALHLDHSDEVTVFSAHDASELAALQG